MKLIIKLAGMVLIVLCFSMLGFLKALSKREYIKRLKSIDSSLIRASSLLKYGTFNRQKILETAFLRVPGFSISAEGAEIKDKMMSKDISTMLNLFLKDFGSVDTACELTRIKGNRDTLLREIKRLEDEYKTVGKLWRTAGVCAGLALGIMLI